MSTFMLLFYVADVAAGPLTAEKAPTHFGNPISNPLHFTSSVSLSLDQLFYLL